jgi:uncharacterized membrane protein YuzA (DUF378 family)
MAHLAKILVIIGGLNWGLVGVGELVGKDFNVVELLSTLSPIIPTIVYLVVGVSAIILIFKKA